MPGETPSYVWVRRRTRHSSGPGTWDPLEVERYDWQGDDEEFLNRLAKAYSQENDTHSEHFRGAEAEFWNPDPEFVRAEVQRNQEALVELCAYRERLRIMMMTHIVEKENS